MMHINYYRKKSCLTIFHHKKKIFDRTFQIAVRNLKAVKVQQTCLPGTLLENVLLEVSDGDGLIDESMHGPPHALSIRSNELEPVEGAQYAFERGRCVVTVPREPGTVTVVAYHTHFPDLETKIQIPVYDLDLVPVKNKSEPICSYPTSSVSSHNLLSPSQLGSSQSSILASHIMEKASDEIGNIDSEIHSEEKLIKDLYSHKISLGDRIVDSREVGAKELTRHKIEENVGTVADRKVRRMLSGVCAMVSRISLHTLWRKQLIGVPIRRRFPIICLDRFNESIRRRPDLGLKAENVCFVFPTV